MKKIIMVLSILLVGLLFVVGCSETAPAADSTPEAAADAAEVIEEAKPEVVVEEVAEVVPALKEFSLVGTNWEFDVKEIRVNEGDTVKIQFKSESGFHDWVIDEFNAATDQVNSGGTSSVEFIAGTAGTYEYYCSVGNHRQRGMVGTLIVE
jgi:plastocyanin